MSTDAWDVEAIRKHFVFARAGRIATNNAASTRPPRELLDLHHALAPQYENVHRGQSSASQHTTRAFEAAYDDIARFVGAASRNNIVVVRNTTEAINAVMYSLMTEERQTRPRSPGRADRFAHQARVLHGCLELSRHEDADRRRARAGGCERLRAARR